ncbi:carbohydrate binding domain-containing protein [Pseudomonas sp. AN3A02]|uniref:carbohydrate binding domain-containing protein n=1 Tax=Pseudomonas sp. AN3A02 TaxID=2719587 RepID=UPI001430E30E|nr:carbohydrate binding domain-containing protein [Pseudomonas sp. AN3A02]NIL18281.1 hypothetical protein [Pseudomonas sp. AN3A02]
MPKSGVTTDLLPPAEIPLSQPPIPGDADNADYGIGLRHVEHPLVVYIERPDATPPGTVFQLFWGSLTQPVAFNLLGDGDEGLTRIPFTVTQDYIRESWADPVFARVLRENGTNSETRPLRLRVNLQRPGGRDPDDDLPGHQKLILELPLDVVRDGISDARAHQGVEVICRHWENMFAYDLVILAWGSETITHRVQPDQVARDISLTIDYPTILAAGNGEIIPVGFQVMGPTGNYPDEWARWSAAQWVDVHADNDRLDPPRVKFPVTERDIDLEQLGARDVIISAHVGLADASAYSLLTLIWAGTDRDGVSVPYIPSITIVAGSNGIYDFDIPHALMATIAQGTVVVHYLLQGAGAPDKRSDNLHLRVIGEVAKWPAPTIDEAPAGHLDPDLPEATVRFPFQESWPGDALLEVVFVAGDAESTVEHRIGREVDEIPPTTGGYMLFTVHTADLKRFEGYFTDVYYVLTKRNTPPDETPQESLRLKVQVGEPARELPKPIVQQAPDGLLNPDDITDYAKVIAPFTETLRADWINMFWIGPNAHTSVMVQVGIDGTTTEHDILIDYITPNLDQEVMVFYTLIRGDKALRHSHITTVLISHASLELLAPELDKAISTGQGTATLAPLDAEGGAKLVVSYADMLGSDTIQVTMKGTAGAGSPLIPSKPGNETTKRVEFDISEMAIVFNIHNRNNVVAFDYTVTRNEEPQSSHTLFVTITPIPSISLPQPLINNVTPNGILDIRALPANAKLTIKKWPFQYSGMKVWLTYRSMGAMPDPNLIWQGIPLSSDNGVEHEAPLAWLATCANGAEVSIEFKLAYDPSEEMDNAISLPRTTYRILTNSFFESATFDNRSLNGWRRHWEHANATSEFLSRNSGYYWSSTVTGLTGTAGTVTGLIKDFPITLFVPGVQYTISFDYLYRLMGDVQSRISVDQYLRSDAIDRFVDQSFSNIGSWATFTHTFSPQLQTPGSYIRVVLYVNCRNSAEGTSISLDNISIRATGI